MSVNRKIFGLASSVVVFAGMAYGQALQCNVGAAAGPILINGTASNGTITTSPSNPIELRAEGATELVSDTVTPCNGTTSGSFRVTSLPSSRAAASRESPARACPEAL